MNTLRVLLPTLLAVGVVLSLSLWMVAHAQPGADASARAKAFLTAHEQKVRPLDIAAGRAWWDANVSGKDEDYAKKEAAQNAVDAVLADPKTFAELKAIKTLKDNGEIKDAILARAVDVVYLLYLEKQVDPALLKQITAKANAVEKTFNNYRAKVDGKEMTDSEVRKVLKDSKDSARRQAVWEASKGVGAAVEADLKELVKLRNEAAVKLGYKNFHEMMLFLNEQKGPDLIALFDDLDQLTRAPFQAAKAEIDAKLAADFGVKPGELMPWHVHDPFFQEAPAIYAASLDEPYKQADLLQLCRQFYAGIGLPIEKVIARSDLYEKKGKSPHAFCTDIDRDGDVRVLANIVNNEYWMGTMLHELGHSVYSTHNNNIPKELPYVLRGEAHILTTEGVAMQFERFSKQRPWLEKMGLKVTDGPAFDEAARKIQRNQLLIFSRWCQVMLRFEKGMYENPGQDLNKLWWDLVEQYQGLKRPTGRNAPDYGSKIHIVSAPVYYHNYQMGQLFASQVHHTIVKELYAGKKPSDVLYIDDKRVGQFMIDRVFAPGRKLDWQGLTKFATGADLNPKAFAADFQGS
jgi:peptidyl-dipeptidase A